MKKKEKIIVILGPTASGKTELSLDLAKKYNGEIVNADSRQIYKRMLIGTDKPVGRWKSEEGRPVYMVKGVPHHLVDFVEPNQDFSLAEYKTLAIQAIEDILKRKKMPIIVGGTGLYISSIIDNLDIPKVAPSRVLRAEFEKKSLGELVKQLELIDPKAAQIVDLKNPRRIIRALEVAIITGKSFTEQSKKSPSPYDALQIGLKLPKEELSKRIEERVENQLKTGLVDEVRELLDKYDNGFWVFPAMSSIGYREVASYITKQISREEASELMKKRTRDYAKRQMTWFKKDKRIKWVKDKAEAMDMAHRFINKK